MSLNPALPAMQPDNQQFFSDILKFAEVVKKTLYSCSSYALWNLTIKSPPRVCLWPTALLKFTPWAARVVPEVVPHDHTACSAVCVWQQFGFLVKLLSPRSASLLQPCNSASFFAFLAHLIHSNSRAIIKERMFPSRLWMCMFASCVSTCMWVYVLVLVRRQWRRMFACYSLCYWTRYKNKPAPKNLFSPPRSRHFIVY